MERAVEVFAAVQFLVIGLSHVFQPRVWVEFFTWLRGKGYAGVFVNGFLSLGFGAFIVAFHNVWTGLPMVLTHTGSTGTLLIAVTPVLDQWTDVTTYAPYNDGPYFEEYRLYLDNGTLAAI